MDPKAVEKMVAEAVTKAIAPLTATIDTLKAENTVLKMSDKHKAHHATLSGDAKDKFAAMSPEERDSAMEKTKKAAELPPEITKALEIASTATANAATLAKRVDVLEDEKQLVVYNKRAIEMGLPESDGAILMKAAKGDPAAVKEAFEKMAKVGQALKAQAEAGGLFIEFGKGGSATTGDAYGELTAKADELRKTEKKLTPEQAFAKVYQDPSNREIVARYKREDMKKRLHAA